MFFCSSSLKCVLKENFCGKKGIFTEVLIRKEKLQRNFCTKKEYHSYCNAEIEGKCLRCFQTM